MIEPIDTVESAALEVYPDILGVVILTRTGYDVKHLVSVEDLIAMLSILIEELKNVPSNSQSE